MFKQKISFETWGGEKGKYRLVDSDGNHIDKTPEDNCERIAKSLASNETNPDKWEKEFIKILGTKFAGGGRIMANIGVHAYKKEVSPINCFIAGTEITTLNGPRKIEDVNIGDVVPTHNGNWKKVIQKHKNNINDRAIFTLKAYFTPEINVTENHKFWSITSEQLKWGETTPSWNDAKSLREGDWIAIPNIKVGNKNYNLDIFNEFLNKFSKRDEKYWYEIKSENNKVKVKTFWKKNNSHKIYNQDHFDINQNWLIDEDFAFLLGLWYGDGCVFSKEENSERLKGITFTFNKKEEKLIMFIKEYGSKLFGIKADVNNNSNRDNSVQIMFNSAMLGHVFEHYFGRGFANKKIPNFIYQWSKELVESFFAGLISSDGNFTKTGDIRLVLANRPLIKNLFHLGRSFGIPASYSTLKSYQSNRKPTARLTFPNTCYFLNKIIKKYDDERIKKAFSKTSPFIKVINDTTFIKIAKKIKYLKQEDFVYTLGVEEDHSYSVEGLICQNCVVSRSNK